MKSKPDLKIFLQNVREIVAKCDLAANYSIALLSVLVMPYTFPLLMNARNYF